MLNHLFMSRLLVCHIFEDFLCADYLDLRVFIDKKQDINVVLLLIFCRFLDKNILLIIIFIDFLSLLTVLEIG